MWCGDDLFKEKFSQRVFEPYEDPLKFDSELNPINHTIGIIAPPGKMKQQGIRQLLQERKLPSFYVSVKFGKTGVAVQKILSIVDEQRFPVVPGAGSFVNYSIVLGHADVIGFEPDNEETMLFALQMRKYAKANNFVFICLFDRLGVKVDDPNAYRRNFFLQFRDPIYFPTPHSAARLSVFEQRLNAFIEKHKGYVLVDLTPADKVHLQDSMAYNTTDEIFAFLTRVFNDAISTTPNSVFRPVGAESKGPVTINMNVLDIYMFTDSGQKFITGYDPRVELDKYSIAGGRGPIAGVIRKREPIPAAANISGFKKENVDRDVVANKIKKKKKKTKREREDGEEEQEEKNVWMEHPKREGEQEEEKIKENVE
jgi:hypothetical protein